MEVLSAFDGGVSQPHEISGDEITFELKPGQRILNVRIAGPPPELRVTMLFDKKGKGFVARQGLLVGIGNAPLTALPLEELPDHTLRVCVQTEGKDVRLATRYPYGRDALDKLICDTGSAPHGAWHYWAQSDRVVPYFEFGNAAEAGLIHYFVAGEDCWETAGCWVADGIVRLLSTDSPLTETLLAKSAIRVVPLVSPYSATREKASYTTPDDKGIYGAATWGDAEPPPEYALIRAQVEDAIRAGRLGLLLTLHSWQAQQATSNLQTIRAAGENALSESRAAWATDTLARMIEGVPHGATSFPEKIWHPGLARDYLLAAHNAITFRVEVTTAGQGHDGFRETAERFLANLAALDDWAPVCGG